MLKISQVKRPMFNMMMVLGLILVAVLASMGNVSAEGPDDDQVTVSEESSEASLSPGPEYTNHMDLPAISDETDENLDEILQDEKYQRIATLMESRMKLAPDGTIALNPINEAEIGDDVDIFNDLLQQLEKTNAFLRSEKRRLSNLELNVLSNQEQTSRIPFGNNRINWGIGNTGPHWRVRVQRRQHGWWGSWVTKHYRTSTDPASHYMRYFYGLESGWHRVQLEVRTNQWRTCYQGTLWLSSNSNKWTSCWGIHWR